MSEHELCIKELRDLNRQIVDLRHDIERLKASNGTLSTRNAKLKERVAKLEKVREAAEYTVLAMEWTDTDLNKALDNIKLLEDVRKTAEGYSIPGVTHKLNKVLDIAKRIEWVLADGSMILPKSGLHALLKDALKDCEI